jgi:transmembrane sensor
VSRFLEIIKKLAFGTSKPRDTEEEINGLLSKDFARLRTTDPETNLQWMRLQRSLAVLPQEMRTPQTRLVPRLAFGIAVIAVAIVGAYLLYSPGEMKPDIFATRKGEQTQIVLHDNSEVMLNYATELTVPRMEKGKTRLLSLKGEAFFRVSRNETPFIVSTEYADVQVVGTEFNVRSREGMLEVAVVHGIVNVTGMKNSERTTLTLTKGQRAVCLRDGVPQRIENISLPEYPGWMHGKIHFDKSTFADACLEIEMRFNVVTKIQDGSVGSELVTGTLNAKDAASALMALCKLAGKQVRHDGDVYTIY